MKITPKILRQRAKRSLADVLHLDLTNLGIGEVEGIENCPRLQSIDLSNNCLEEFDNYQSCLNLWRIDLSNNKIKSLSSLAQMFAIGTLDLSNNLICWNELSYLRNVHILDLRLHGNSGLANDTYYRLHVIDCLPSIWMLDGRLITSAERLQVHHFFHDSALSSHPVRHKLNEKTILTSKANDGSIHGCRTYEFTASFPVNGPQNSDTDKRRLLFLADQFSKDLSIIVKTSVHNELPANWLSHIINNRHRSTERCNMLLLLLVSFLEFDLPLELIDQTLSVAKLNPLFGINTMILFKLGSQVCVEVISLLVSTCKLDREVHLNKATADTGGLYDRLYLCLYHAVSHLLEVRVMQQSQYNQNLDKQYPTRLPIHTRRPHTAPPNHRKSTAPYYASKPKRGSLIEWKSHQCLLASELVLLLSVVPSFYYYISTNHRSISKLLHIATGDAKLASHLNHISRELSVSGGDASVLYREICKSVVRRIERAVRGQNVYLNKETSKYDTGDNLLLAQTSAESRTQVKLILNTAQAYPKRPKSAILSSGEHLMTGKSRIVPKSSSYMDRTTTPALELGSNVLLGAQNLSRVIAMPEQNVALVQMDAIPAANGSVVIQTQNAEEHYAYVDVHRLEYDKQAHYWRPTGSVGDKVTLQTKALMADIVSTDKLNVPADRKLITRNSPKRQRSIVCVLDQSEDQHGENKPEEVADTTQSLSTVFCEKMHVNLSNAIENSGLTLSASELWENPVDLQPQNGAENQAFITQYSDEVHNLLENENLENVVKSSLEDIPGMIKGFADDLKADGGLSGSEPGQDETIKMPTTNGSDSTNAVEQLVNDEQLNKNSSLERETVDDNEDYLVTEDNNDLENDNWPGKTYVEESVKSTQQNVQHRRAHSARLPKHAVNSASPKATRPLSAVIPRHKQVMFQEQNPHIDDMESRPGSASSFQLQRTEAWRSSASSRSGFSHDKGFQEMIVDKFGLKGRIVKGMQKPPPQRPTSPEHGSIKAAPLRKKTYSSISTRSLGGRTRSSVTSENVTLGKKTYNTKGGLLSATHWLADGRNVHKEKEEIRKFITSPRLPGYLVGTNMLPTKGTSKPSSVTRQAKPFHHLPMNYYRNLTEPGTSLGGALVWHRPQYSALNELRKLSAKPSYVTRRRTK